MEDKKPYTVDKTGDSYLTGVDLSNKQSASRVSVVITPELLKSMGYGLDECLELINQLQEASKAIMNYAWENKFHTELAAHITGLKVPPTGG